MNKTVLTLIPKSDHPEHTSHFRPISLCTTQYKVIAKTVANRLKPNMEELVSPTQSSFIQGKHITDNIIIAQEVIHSIKKKMGKKGMLAIKMDLEKAYDQLRWDFILDAERSESAGYDDFTHYEALNYSYNADWVEWKPH